MSRPVLLAMNNPLSGDPDHALYPAPRGCAGHRLWEMLDAYSRSTGEGEVSTAAYRRAFDRRNLLNQRSWSVRDARMSARAMLPELTGCVVVVLGVQTLDALRSADRTIDRPSDWGEWLRWPALLRESRMVYTLLPHPSGRCREYNDPSMRRRAGRVLYDLYAAALSE